MTHPSTHGGPSPRTQLELSVPAIMVGAVSALGLFAVDELALVVEHFVWGSLPSAWGVDPGSGWWIVAILSLTGLAVGLIVQFVPGHGGRDSATTELVAPPLNLGAVPSLVAVTALGLGGGVSLGPEIAIIAINTAILAALTTKFWPRIPIELVVMVTAAGTIGALFGTPVAAALVFTGIVAAYKDGGAVWDRLFLPLVSAGAGSVMMRWLDGPQLPETGFAPLGTPNAAHLAAGVGVAVGGTLVGLVAVVVFPLVHRFFHGLKHPAIYITLGGLVLGILGAIGGPVTLFKGAHQTVELVRHAADYSVWQLLLIIAVKVAALVVAASAGFRGGRIFPAVFIGAAVGLLGYALIPGVPPGLAIACGILGVVLPVARDGWIALFIAVVVVGDATVLPVLCLAILPTWLMVSRAPEMMIVPESPQPASSSVDRPKR